MRCSKKVAQVLVEYNFTDACKNSTKLRPTFFQHGLFNHYVNFQSKFLNNKCRNDSCFKIGCRKIHYRRYQQYWMCMACTLYDILLKGRSARFVSVPNCHNDHLRYILNRCIAQLSSCSDSNVQ